MKYLLGLLMSMSAHASPILIGVIDTGFNLKNMENANLCKKGHTDLTSSKDPLTDKNGHGTNIAEIIGGQLKGLEKYYCIVIIKYWEANGSLSNAMVTSAKAFEIANRLKFDVVNYSSNGDSEFEPEKYQVLRFLNKGGALVAAAGNDHLALSYNNGWKIPFISSERHESYPGMYDKRIVMVGNLSKDGSINKSSNFGPAISRWEVGEQVYGGKTVMTGTSQATAVVTGKLVRKMIEEKYGFKRNR